MADVARRAGTSTAVVSYVMNDGPRPVAVATRERVLAAAADLRYRPNRIARALRARRTGVAGLILADASNPYFAALAREIERALADRDTLTLVGNAGHSPARQKRLAERFLAAQVDGLVVVSAEGGADVAAEAEAHGTRAVHVHHRPRTAHGPLVPADNAAAVRAAVDHLRGHGHERIDFLSGPTDAGPVGVRRRAWARATPGTLLRCTYSRADAADLTERLAATDTLPSALVVATDEQAIGVLAGACRAGVAVPGRLAVVSLDGAPDTAYTAPALTVTAQPLTAMADRAVDQLLTGEADDTPLTAPLITRATCGCPDRPRSGSPR
ncbi:LacI family DNA-binding transcriptional regulator [Actinocatenispora rupis]|uniref:Putative HTH-type transcriptional regulator n=2 Tax=Actinocatenispora rupis TaxID=519421 RepID=A0A8J3J0Z8_9ACTN|nr:putative HTH-type transcriptional regulator [Actinocatenispora rupis]